MPARTCDRNAEIDHLSGKDKCSEDSHQGNSPVIGIFPKFLRRIRGQTCGRDPHRAPNCGRNQSVGHMQDEHSFVLRFLHIVAPTSSLSIFFSKISPVAGGKNRTEGDKAPADRGEVRSAGQDDPRIGKNVPLLAKTQRFSSFRRRADEDGDDVAVLHREDNSSVDGTDDDRLGKTTFLVVDLRRVGL